MPSGRHNFRRNRVAPYKKYNTLQSSRIGHQSRLVIRARVLCALRICLSIKMRVGRAALTRNPLHPEPEPQRGVRTFVRRFKQATGDSPLVYLQKLRVAAAKRMLENHHRSMQEISGAVGYPDTNFFRALFQRHTGVSPSAYEKGSEFNNAAALEFSQSAHSPQHSNCAPARIRLS